MMQRTQGELAALYEQQQTEAGRAAMIARKVFLKDVHERLGLFMPSQEVVKMVNCQTGEERYYMKG